MMAAARAQWPRPAGMAIVFGVDVASREKALLFRAIHSARNIAQRMLAGIDETMARRNALPDGPTPTKPSPRAAGMRFVHPLHQLGHRVADVRKAMHLSAKRVSLPLFGQQMELIEHDIHASVADRIKTVRRSGYGRESDFMKPEILFQMAVNPNHIGNSGSESHARGNGPGSMIRDQSAHARRDDVVTAAVPLAKTRSLFMQFGRTIHGADGHPDAVF